MPAPSYADILNSGFRAIAIRPSPFTQHLAREPESTANIVCHVNASMAEETALYLDRKLAEVQFVTAVKIGGVVLDRLLYDRYGDDFEPRRTAAVAVATLSLWRTGDVGFAVPALTRVASKNKDGITFITTQAIVFQPGDKGPIEVFAYCAPAGMDGNVVEDTLTELLDRPPEDKTLQVTNLEPAAGGAPREEDGQVAARGRGFWTAARKGTRAAVEYAARTVPGVAIAVASERLNPFTKLPKWRGEITVADRSGNGNSALAARVSAVMDETRALGVPVVVYGGTSVYLTIEIVGLVFKDAKAAAALREDIRAALVADVALLTGGEPLSIGLIFATLLRFKELGVFAPEDCIVVPAEDRFPTSPSKAIRTRGDLIKINGL